MRHKKHPVTDILARGKENAISRKNLMRYFNTSERELYDQIMRERLEGELILSTKRDGGGYYLPANPDEIEEYLALLQRGINTQLDVYNAIKKTTEQKSPIAGGDA